MIIDSHTRAWARWPYQPPVPDDKSRGNVEQLLHEMDLHDVDKAVLICARIERNPDNNDYASPTNMHWKHFAPTAPSFLKMIKLES